MRYDAHSYNIAQNDEKMAFKICFKMYAFMNSAAAINKSGLNIGGKACNNMSKYPNEIHFPMTREQKHEVLAKVKSLSDAGREDEADELLATFPVLPSVAMTMKQVLGLEYLKQSGINLYPAIEKFGEDWLEDD